MIYEIVLSDSILDYTPSMQLNRTNKIRRGQPYSFERIHALKTKTLYSANIGYCHHHEKYNKSIHVQHVCKTVRVSLRIHTFLPQISHVEIVRDNTNE